VSKRRNAGHSAARALAREPGTQEHGPKKSIARPVFMGFGPGPDGLWPLCAGILRLLLAVTVAWLMQPWTGDLGYMFISPGLGLAAYGLVNAAAVKAGAWFTGPRRARISGATSTRPLPAR